MPASEKCKFCHLVIDPVTMDWALAYDPLTDISYVYHVECFDEA